MNSHDSPTIRLLVVGLVCHLGCLYRQIDLYVIYTGRRVRILHTHLTLWERVVT